MAAKSGRDIEEPTYGAGVPRNRLIPLAVGFAGGIEGGNRQRHSAGDRQVVTMGTYVCQVLTALGSCSGLSCFLLPSHESCIPRTMHRRRVLLSLASLPQNDDRMPATTAP